jgi:hypothetical protein
MKAIQLYLDRIEFILELTTSKRNALMEKQSHLLRKKEKLVRQTARLQNRMEQLKEMKHTSMAPK